MSCLKFLTVKSTYCCSREPGSQHTQLLTLSCNSSSRRWHPLMDAVGTHTPVVRRYTCRRNTHALRPFFNKSVSACYNIHEVFPKTFFLFLFLEFRSLNAIVISFCVLWGRLWFSIFSYQLFQYRWPEHGWDNLCLVHYNSSSAFYMPSFCWSLCFVSIMTLSVCAFAPWYVN